MPYRWRGGWGFAMGSRRMGLTRLVLVLAVALCSTCDNDEMTEAAALYAFGTASEAPKDTCSPTEDIYPPPEGTWYDTNSGLSWQVTPTGGAMHWEDVKTHCSNLKLAGGCWRVPDIGELRSLIRGCPNTDLGSDTCKVEPGGCLDNFCNNNVCGGCSSGDGPAGGCYWPDELQGECGWAWSSSLAKNPASNTWYVEFNSASVGARGNTHSILPVRCVR